MRAKYKKLASTQVVAGSVEEQSKEAAVVVHQLNNIELMKCKDGWLEQGRIIAEFVAKCDATPQFKGLGVKMLANHPECLLGHSQIRNYRNCYSLYKQYSGDKFPKLTMSAYVVLLTSSIKTEDRKKLLQKANDESLSVAQIKEEIRKLQPKKPIRRNWADHCTKAASLAGSLLSALSTLDDLQSNRDPKPELPEDLILALGSLGKFMTDHYTEQISRLESASNSTEVVHA